MRHKKRILFGFVVALALTLVFSISCAKSDVEEQAMEPMKEEIEEAKAELPAAVAEVVKSYFPDAQIDKVEVADEAGITLYDIEFKDDAGEIEVVDDGAIIDVVSVVTMEDLPPAAAEAIQNATEGMSIIRLEMSEIHSEIKVEEGVGQVIKLEIHRFVYEAELEKDGQTGEIEVDADGNITEELKWDKKESSTP
jgi:hypothetical protein